MTPVVVPGLFFDNIQRHGISFFKESFSNFLEKNPSFIPYSENRRGNVFIIIT